MVGVPGRSGKLTTAEQKAMASERGKAAAEARWGTSESPPASALPPPDPNRDPSSDDPVKRLGKPVTWGDELKRQQVEGERIQNRRREVEVQRAEVELHRAKDEADEARGKLLSKDAHRAAVAAIVAEIVEAASGIVSAAVEMHPPEQQPMARHTMDRAVAEWRKAAMARIKTL